jgi:hypothetical protein
MLAASLRTCQREPHTFSENSNSLLVVTATGADTVEELTTGTQVENELSSVSFGISVLAPRLRDGPNSFRDTYVKVVARLKKVVELHNVGVACGDFLKNVDFIADLVTGQYAAARRVDLFWGSG